jgi:hypothetical protein
MVIIDEGLATSKRFSVVCITDVGPSRSAWGGGGTREGFPLVVFSLWAKLTLHLPSPRFLWTPQGFYSLLFVMLLQKTV